MFDIRYLYKPHTYIVYFHESSHELYIKILNDNNTRGSYTPIKYSNENFQRKNIHNHPP